MPGKMNFSENQLAKNKFEKEIKQLQVLRSPFKCVENNEIEEKLAKNKFFGKVPGKEKWREKPKN